MARIVFTWNIQVEVRLVQYPSIAVGESSIVEPNGQIKISREDVDNTYNKDREIYVWIKAVGMEMHIEIGADKIRNYDKIEILPNKIKYYKAKPTICRILFGVNEGNLELVRVDPLDNPAVITGSNDENA